MKIKFRKIPALILAMLLCLTGCMGQYPRPKDFYDCVTAINAGQAQSVLIESDNTFALIDAGQTDSGTNVVSYLQDRGARDIELLVLTHFHSDHTSETTKILKNFNVKKILIPNLSEENTPTSKFFERLIEGAENGDYEIYTAEKGKSFTIGNGTLTVLADTINDKGINDTSTALMYTQEDFTFVDFGDLETDGQEVIIDSLPENVTLAMAPHHGSRDSNSQMLYEKIHPLRVFISAGKDNKYGHPHSETISVLEKLQIPYYITRQDGSLTWYISDGTLSLED